MYNFTIQENQLADAMTLFWTNFAKNFNPGSFNGVTWPELGHDLNLVLDEKLSIEQGMGIPELCDFWDSHDPGFMDLLWRKRGISPN